MKKTINITSVNWDTDNSNIKLPQKFELTLNQDILNELKNQNLSESDYNYILDEYISDTISNIYGYCHFGFTYN